MAFATVTPSEGLSADIHGSGKTQIRTLGDLGRAVARLDQDISALGTECCGYGLCECVDTFEKRCSGFYAKLEVLQNWSASGIHWQNWCEEAAYLVCESLLLEVQARRPKLRALVEGGSPRPRCKCSLHCVGLKCVCSFSEAQTVLLDSR
jgi:hypothetical protein